MPWHTYWVGSHAEPDGYDAPMVDMDVEITVADGFDPSPLIDQFAERAERTGDLTWRVRFASTLHGLALVNASSEEEIVSVAGFHPVDPDGWADWRQSAPGEHEMTDALLPQLGRPATTDTAYRYDEAWVWDPNAPAASSSTLEVLGLAGLAEQRSAAAGRGDWIVKAVKFAWKSPLGRDLRIQAAWWLTKQGWKVLQQQSYEQRARMEQREFERRLILDLNETRRERLERGSESSRRKARQYYTTLDALIAANS